MKSSKEEENEGRKEREKEGVSLGQRKEKQIRKGGGRKRRCGRQKDEKRETEKTKQKFLTHVL